MSRIKTVLLKLTFTSAWSRRLLYISWAFSGSLLASFSIAFYFDLIPTDEPLWPNETTSPRVFADTSAAMVTPPSPRLSAPPPRPLIGALDDSYLPALLGMLEVKPDDGVARPMFDRDRILNDGDHKISEDFSVPAGLRDRVSFWFDVYTKYDANRRIVHHSRYPWIVFKVVDVSPIINAQIPKHRWLRNLRADEAVREETERIRRAAQSLGRRKSLSHLNEDEESVAEILKPLGGDLRKQARLAAKDIRVQTGQRNFFMEGLEVSPRYLATMERIFRERKMPIELTRLPFVESSFNKRATSKVGASGIWQFMGNTGRKFMMVSGKIDERRSPFKATEAAAQLLKENHMILHRSWPLAVTAWNHGPSGVRKAIKRARSRDLSTIVARYRSRSFDFASSNFYAEFLAALHAEQYQAEVFGGVEKETALDLKIVQLPRAIRVADVIRVSGLTRDEFLLLNPELKPVSDHNSMLPAGFRLHVPEHARTGIEQHLASGDPRRIVKKSS
jgi:membrane-bound lytic murein transglycosylase D